MRHTGPTPEVWSAALLAIEPTLTLFQKVLLSTDGTVTELVSLYAGRPIRARKISQSIGYAAAPAPLQTDADARILHRTIVLEDDTGAPYLYADSYFIVDRFSEAIQRDLVETDLPIGLLWRRERLEMYREMIDHRREQCAVVAALLQVDAMAALLSRSYVIVHGGQPLGVITEKFAADVLH